jgi:hypothetical protein
MRSLAFLCAVALRENEVERLPDLLRTRVEFARRIEAFERTWTPAKGCAKRSREGYWSVFAGEGKFAHRWTGRREGGTEHTFVVMEGEVSWGEWKCFSEVGWRGLKVYDKGEDGRWHARPAERGESMYTLSCGH